MIILNCFELFPDVAVCDAKELTYQNKLRVYKNTKFNAQSIISREACHRRVLDAQLVCSGGVQCDTSLHKIVSSCSLFPASDNMLFTASFSGTLSNLISVGF